MGVSCDVRLGISGPAELRDVLTLGGIIEAVALETSLGAGLKSQGHVGLQQAPEGGSSLALKPEMCLLGV